MIPVISGICLQVKKKVRNAINPMDVWDSSCYYIECH